MKIAYVWDQFGEYHVDRCEAVARAIPHAQVLGIEFAASSLAYAWPPTGPGECYEKATLFQRGPFEATGWFSRLFRLVRAARGQDAVFLAGYERPDIFFAGIILRLLGRYVYIMNDSKFNDKPRHVWWEWLKSLALSPYNGALVAGVPQADYFRFLGFKGPIALGYDTVSLGRLRGYVNFEPSKRPLADRPFLFIGRFVAKKNVLGLIRAYSRYVASVGATARKMVMIGDGPLREEVGSMLQALELADQVQMTGFLDGPGVATALRDAYALVVPSVEDQWALVVNEALAFDLPVIASTAVGAASILVRAGLNGLIVEPGNEEGLHFALSIMDESEARWRQFSAGSKSLAHLADVTEFVNGTARLLGISESLGTA